MRIVGVNLKIFHSRILHLPLSGAAVGVLEATNNPGLMPMVAPDTDVTCESTLHPAAIGSLSAITPCTRAFTAILINDDSIIQLRDDDEAAHTDA